MAKFLTGNELNLEVEKIFEEAEFQIVLISPYIKLHDRYASVFRTKLNDDKLEIIIVFGKNEDDLSRSMKQEDFNFFKDFPNIQIRYEKRLHAKYYSNEETAILTSMNLYSYSQDINIEAGVMTKKTIFGDIANKIAVGEDTFDTKAWTYFKRVIEQSELLYHRVPQYDKGVLSSGINRRYIGSEIKVDKLTDFFTLKDKAENVLRIKSDPILKGKIYTNPTQEMKLGYCIRTGKQIPFNPDKPFSEEAYLNWSKFGNEEYPEKYCHFLGEPSYGETTKAKPILRKNWNEAKKKFKL